MRSASKKEVRRTARAEKKSNGFGFGVSWKPDDLPIYAAAYWPQKVVWPNVEDVRLFVESTEDERAARLAVLTGLRRWSEPGSSQLMVSLGAMIVSIVAIAIGAGDFHPGLFLAISVAAVGYISAAVVAISQAVKMDDRRKMAHGWLRAIEDELPVRKIDAQADLPSPRRSRFGLWRT